MILLIYINEIWKYSITRQTLQSGTVSCLLSSFETLYKYNFKDKQTGRQTNIQTDRETQRHGTIDSASDPKQEYILKYILKFILLTFPQFIYTFNWSKLCLEFSICNTYYPTTIVNNWEQLQELQWVQQIQKCAVQTFHEKKRRCRLDALLAHWEGASEGMGESQRERGNARGGETTALCAVGCTHCQIAWRANKTLALSKNLNSFCGSQRTLTDGGR